MRRGLLLIAAAALGFAGHALGQTREEAVQAARAGRYDEAVGMLERLRARGADRRVDDDLAVLLAWAGRPADALAVFAAAGPTRAAPAYVRSAMIEAARDTRRFAEAERLAREGMALEPASREWPPLLALSLADGGCAAEALRILDPLLAADPGDAGAWMARAYAASQAGDRYAALRAYGEARRLEPDDRDAAAGIARVLRDLGAPNGAAAAFPPAPLPLQAEQAAARLRWGTQVLPRDSIALAWDYLRAPIFTLTYVAALPAAEQAREVGVDPAELARWREWRVAVVEFDQAGRPTSARHGRMP